MVVTQILESLVNKNNLVYQLLKKSERLNEKNWGTVALFVLFWWVAKDTELVIFFFKWGFHIEPSASWRHNKENKKNI